MLVKLAKEVNQKISITYYTLIYLGLNILFSIALSFSAGYLISQAALQIAAGLLHIPIAFVRLFGLLKPFSRYFESYYSHNDMLLWIKEVRLWFYRRFKNLPMPFIQQYSHGQFFKQMTSDMKNLENFSISGLIPIIGSIFAFIFISTILLFSSPLMALINGIIFIFIAVVIPVLTNKLNQSMHTMRDQLHEHQTEIGYELSYGFREVTLFPNVRKQLFSLIHKKQKKIDHLDYRINLILSFFSTFSKGLSLSFFLILPFYLWSISTNQTLIIITSLSYLAYIELIENTASSLFKIFTSSQSAKNMFYTLPTSKISPQVTHKPWKLEKQIQFKNLSFQYPETPLALIKNFNLTLPAKKHNLVHCESGSGKSTLLKLLLKYYQSTQGDITLDGQSLWEIDTQEHYEKIAYISQKTFLFSSSIRENLLIANPSSSDEELLNALSLVGLTSLLQSRDGLDTIIGEVGNKISGGEKQRIAIARAYLKSPDLLLLDEPTSSLDWRNKEKIDELLSKTILKNKTVLHMEVNENNCKQFKNAHFISLSNHL